MPGSFSRALHLPTIVKYHKSLTMSVAVNMAEGKDWQIRLRRDGYALFRNLCPEPIVSSARLAIDHDLATNYDPSRQVEYDHLSYCPALRCSPLLMALLLESGITAKLDEVIGFHRLRYGACQIALRKAGNAPEPYPLEPHIDGLPMPFNGVPSNILVSNFTVLVGVYLSPVRTEFAGNFTVWPGSHHVLQAHFREHGRKALRNGMPQIPLGEPVQLMTESSDVVLCHYGLAHTAAVNLSAVDRYAVYFRLWLRGIKYRRWHFMTHIWRGWRIS
jgi:hypothetical protein